MFGEGTYIWTFLIAILTVLLGIAIYIGFRRSRRATPRQQAQAEQGAHDIYQREDKSNLP